MSEVALVNRSNRTHVIVLDHEVFRDKLYGFRVTSQPSLEQSREGAVTPRQLRRAIPGSLTLLPGGRVENLHPAIRNVTQIKRLLALDPPQVAIEDMPTPEPAKERIEKSRPPQAGSARDRLGASKDE